MDQSVWDLFIQNPTSNNGGSRSLSKAARSVLQDIHEINNWIEKLLDSPVPEEGRTRVELELFPKHIIPRQPLVFALPEKQSKCISINIPELLKIDEKILHSQDFLSVIFLYIYLWNFWVSINVYRYVFTYICKNEKEN